MATEPASIRYNNPGAMWGGNKISKRWGEVSNVVLNDGKGQNNHIAGFPDTVHGAAAQFDLWRSNYSGMTLIAAVTKWSGGNSSPAYIKFLYSQTGLSPSSPITVSVLSSPTGLKLMKAQAQWEAGRPYPMSDEEWAQAQIMVFKTNTAVNSVAPVPPAPPTHSTPIAPPTPAPQPWLGSIYNWLKRH